MTSMTAIELVAVRDALRARLAELDAIRATCEHCEHYAQPPMCRRFNAEPPEEFRRDEGACPEWRFDGVPF
ncbi:hypothetical protein LCC91_07860 [Tepidimonas taiwanensis]|uniref:Uncharacterized protein n=1 Tax=Tepidimonas taiwanensis TaxID=307486 RepID=A0A554XAW4_9BURK|nr:hypothetical protein [Tepidimonas taiwanensis]TSE32975.1 hypothetical protein Ttaiw_00836 [Tepidimonas taiwanensis]UBQ04490.1 hypothetical protein LCC91_07860 [Tepidimonas taiwanensis]